MRVEKLEIADQFLREDFRFLGEIARARPISFAAGIARRLLESSYLRDEIRLRGIQPLGLRQSEIPVDSIEAALCVAHGDG